MRKLMITALVAASTAAAAAPAQAQTQDLVAYTGPCASAVALMEKYNIQFGFQSDEFDLVWRTVCGVTG